MIRTTSLKGEDKEKLIGIISVFVDYPYQMRHICRAHYSIQIVDDEPGWVAEVIRQIKDDSSSGNL